MSQKKRPTFKKRLNQRLKRLSPLIKALRPGLKDDMSFILKLAEGGARVRDWLERNKPKASRAHGPSHQLHEPGPIEKRGKKKWVNSGLPNNLDHISLEDRDLARLELLRAFHDGPEAFVAKREELMKRFKIDRHQKREIILGAFWGHLNGHRRKQFVTRILAMASSQGKRRDKILGDLAKLYRVQPHKLVMEVDAHPTLQ